jgi:hypothetical protein
MGANVNPNDKTKFFEIMTGLAENFSAQFSGPGLKLRFDALSQYDITQIETAAVKILHSRDKMGMPTVAEFVKAIEGDRKPEDAAVNQVNEILKQIRDLGSYRTPAFSDPVTASLMKSRWSWRSVCSMTETELKWFAKEFSEAYQSAERATQPMIANNAAGKLRLLAGGIG